MGQPKGTSGNPSGRPKGTPNKVTSTMREWVSEILANNQKQLEADFKALTPKERWQIAERLMNYVMPKQQAISGEIVEREVGEPKPDLSRVPDWILEEAMKYIYPGTK